MENIIKRIYDLIYSPIITPYNLLENAKLDNYMYVNYYKGDSGLISEMKCIFEGEETIFYYHFDSEDKLQKVFMDQMGTKTLIFERTAEIEQIKKQIIKSDSHAASA
jgi:hypothetical protein